MKTHRSRHRSTYRRAATAAAIAFAGFGVATQASAARVGSVPEFPVGITMGSPTGALPPQGLFVIWKPTYANADSVNGNGDKTGATSTTWSSNAQIMWVPGIKVLGANYAAFIRNIGEVNISLTTPTGKTISAAQLPDTEIIPVNLSWKLKEHLFLDAELGFYLNDGGYKNAPGRINIGQNERTIEPNVSLTYMDSNWLLSGHLVFDINGWNNDAGTIDGQTVSYKNGTTADLDWTLFHRTGHWNYGLVGYFLRQISADQGPAQLNGGRPWQYAAGVGGSYSFGRVNLNVNYTHDYFARNVGKKNMLMFILSAKLM